MLMDAGLGAGCVEDIPWSNCRGVMVCFRRDIAVNTHSFMNQILFAALIECLPELQPSSPCDDNFAIAKKSRNPRLCSQSDDFKRRDSKKDRLLYYRFGA